MSRVFFLIICFGVFTQVSAQSKKVLIHTEYGDMKAVLYDETPQHRDNFIKLVNEGFYNDLLFHRVIEGFMIQGGDPDSKNARPGKMLGSGGPGYSVPAEINGKYIHCKGALSAARKPDHINPEKESSGSQFYVVQGKVFSEQDILNFENKKKNSIVKKRISEFARSHRKEITSIRKEYSADSMRSYQIAVQRKIIDEIKDEEYKFNQMQKEAYTKVGGTPFLDNQYTVFGQVIEGLSVIDSIAIRETDKRDRPIKDIKMTISILNE